MVSLRRLKRSKVSPELDCVHSIPLDDEDEPEELNLPKETKTVSVRSSAKRKTRKIDELMKVTETEVMVSPKKYQVDDLKEPVCRWKKVLKKKSQKVSEDAKDELEKIVKKPRTKTDLCNVTDTLGNEEVENKIDTKEDQVNQLEEEKGQLDVANLETEKLHSDVELSRVSVDMTKAQAAAIKTDKDNVEEQNEEMKKNIVIVEAMVEKLKDQKILQKSVAEAARVGCEKLRRDVELSQVAVDMAKTETATLNGEEDKVKEQNEIEMRKKRKYIAALSSELKRILDEIWNTQGEPHGDCVPDSTSKG